jgi:hypothetical protein
VVLLGAACSLITDEDDGFFRLSLDVTPSVAAPGDTLLFTVTAYNPTDETVDIGFSCGPALDAIVVPPSGEEISVVDSIYRDGLFHCQRLDQHDVEPGETDRVSLRWPAPSTTGRYRAYARVRCPESPCTRSLSEEFEVR